MSSFKFIEEALVVLREEAQVLHAILEVGNTLDTHTEGIASVFLAVDAACLKHVRIDHAATQDLEPS